jgi:hypothetical protein
VEPSTLPKRTITNSVLLERLQCLAQQLCEPLRRAHDVDRIHRLVGRHQDELGGAVRLRGTRHHERDMTLLSNAWKAFSFLHQRDVLVCGGMKHDIRLVMLENFADSRPVARVPYRWHHGSRGHPVAKLLCDGIQTRTRRARKE